VPFGRSVVVLLFGLYTILARPLLYGVYYTQGGSEGGSILRNSHAMNEARLSHLPFWGPSEAVFVLIKRPSG